MVNTMYDRIKSALVVIAVLSLCAPLSQAEDELPVPADEFVYCTVCHGVQLMGNPIIKAPRLSGMETWYVEQQLQNFKKGLRGAHALDPFGFEMQPMAAALSDDQIASVSAFVKATISSSPESTIAGDPEKGKALYATCAACHGADAEGVESLGSPDLRVANDWYLVTQLQNFKNGSRGSHAADSFGMQMRAAAQLLSDDEAIADVVSYISTLK